MNRSKQSIKRITALGAACTLLLTLSAPLANAAAADQVQVTPISAAVQQAGVVELTTKTVTEKSDVLDAELHIPVISGLQDTAYEASLNAKIAKKATDSLEALKKQAKDDEASADGVYEFRKYEMKVEFKLISDGSAASGNVLSFKVLTYFYTGGAHGGTLIDAYNVRNAAHASAVTLNELFGTSYKGVINKAVQAEIRAHQDLYFEDTFKTIADNQPFYIQKGKAVIIFHEYEIAPYASGSPEIAVALPSKTAPAPSTLAGFSIMMNGSTLSGAKLYADRNGIVMAPLRSVTAKLGYTLNWHAGQITLLKGKQSVAFQAGKDAYIAGGKPVKLGAAPVVKGGTLYVPLSFFSKVLGAAVTYTKDSVLIQ
ncbi:stalk domain-containing protein [Paenibacillus silvisoli]|uniref:stalk domain-containing protein n=1 Tax=Paenibacillus silvisoli TaxID=3110539 RepID=UPI00280567E1|nr:DUF4163 domain-containing protein [Paenibacillus silvisoli]